VIDPFDAFRLQEERAKNRPVFTRVLGAFLARSWRLLGVFLARFGAISWPFPREVATVVRALPIARVGLAVRADP
jgi:hypothetical protein